MVEVFKVPNPYSGFGMNPENIKLGAKWGVIPENIKAFASVEDYASQVKTNVPPPMFGDTKYWRDNSFIWNSELDSREYLFFNWTKSGANFSDYSFNIYSPTAAVTYKAYVDVGHIKDIPKINKISLGKDTAGRISFSPGVTLYYPVGFIAEDPVGPIPGGFRGTFPADCLAVFEGNEIVVYKIEDYIKLFPIKTSVTPPGPELTDDEFVIAAKGILEFPKFNNSEKRNRIKAIV